LNVVTKKRKTKTASTEYKRNKDENGHWDVGAETFASLAHQDVAIK
jgi:hypothetical protein